MFGWKQGHKDELLYREMTGEVLGRVYREISFYNGSFDAENYYCAMVGDGGRFGDTQLGRYIDADHAKAALERHFTKKASLWQRLKELLHG